MTAPTPEAEEPSDDDLVTVAFLRGAAGGRDAERAKSAAEIERLNTQWREWARVEIRHAYCMGGGKPAAAVAHAGKAIASAPGAGGET